MQYLETLSGNRYVILRQPLTDELISYIANHHVTIIYLKEYHEWGCCDVSKLASVITSLSVEDDKTPLGFINQLTCLESLDLSVFSGNKISEINFKNLPRLQVLNIAKSSRIPESLQFCLELESLTIGYVLPSKCSTKLPQLKSLCIGAYKNFGESRLLGNFPMITHLSLWGSQCTELRLDGVSSSVKNICINSFNRCVDINCLAGLDQLEALELYSMSALRDLGLVRDCRKLKKADFKSMRSLASIDALANCSQLEEVIFLNCPSILSLSPLTNCDSLKWLALYESTKISDGNIRIMLNHQSLQGFCFENRQHYDIRSEEVGDMSERLKQEFMSRNKINFI